MVSSQRRQTIVITGGAGFIGSHLCDYFIQEGHRVICIDNFLTGTLNNIRQHLKNPKFDVIKQDICDRIQVRGTVHRIFHFASPASPVDYLKYPIKTLKVGSLGTHNALGLAKLKKAIFVLASTSEVYGDPEVHPQVESYWGHVNPIGPRGVYDEAKRFSEAMALAYYRAHKVRVRIGRIFNTYGPRMRSKDGRVIPNFITQALANKPISIFGKGTQTRSFCYVDDLVRGFSLLSQSEYVGPVNLGNPGEYNMIELAHKIIQLTHSKSKLIHDELPVDDPKKRCPDISLAKKILHWEPQIPLEQGLLSTIEYFKKNGKK